MGLGPHHINKPLTACGFFGQGLLICEVRASLQPHLHTEPSSILASMEKAWRGCLPWATLVLEHAPLSLSAGSPCCCWILWTCLQAVAQRPNKCLPSSLMWYTAPVGSVGSLLEDKINFWVMHVGRNNLNETCTLLGYKLTVTAEEKRCGHHPAWLLQTFSCFCCSVTIVRQK